MDNDDWMHDDIMAEENNMGEDNRGEPFAFENNNAVIDCSDAFKTSKVFNSRDEALQWARNVAYEIGFVAVIMRSDTATGKRGRTSFILIGCERSGNYRAFNKDLVRTTTSSRKCGCPFKLRGKPVVGGEGWMVKLICGLHNHRLAKSFTGHPYAGRLTEEEKVIVADMTNSRVKPKNIMLTLKDRNPNSYTTMKQVYNARYAYRTSIRGDNTEMQHLMKLLHRDMYVHWHRVKDENVVRDMFWAHSDAFKLINSCHLVFLINSTYKTNRYRLPLVDIVGVTPTGMTFSAAFAYLEGERTNNLVWALERFRGLFLKAEFFPNVIVTDRDTALMNAIKDVFPGTMNLLCRFHIDKNVKAKYKTLVGQNNSWEYVMEAWGSLVDCAVENEWDECLMRFECVCAPWPIFVQYVKDTWLIPHKERFVTAWTNKVMHFGHTTTNRVESAHWTLKRLLQDSLGDLCNVWDAMNNMITLQHNEIKASFETSTHVVGHMFKTTLYKRLVGMVSRYALNEIAAEFDRVKHVGVDSSRCGCVLRSTHGLPCACELAKYNVGSIPLGTVHMFWRRLHMSDSGLDEMEVTIKEEMEAISNRFESLDLCDKVTLKTKLKEIAYPDQTSMCPPPEKVKTKGAQKKNLTKHQRSTKRDPSYFEYVDALHSQHDSCSSVPQAASTSFGPLPMGDIPMLDQFLPCMRKYIIGVCDVKADGNCGYRFIAAILGFGEDGWPVVRNPLLKELNQWSEDYILLFGGLQRFEDLKRSLLVDGFSMVRQDKWMDVTDMGYVIASRYNLVLVCLSKQQSMTFFPLRSQPPRDPAVHRVICIGHVYGNHFVQVALRDGCPMPLIALLWSRHSQAQAKEWPSNYISRLQTYTSLTTLPPVYVDLGCDRGSQQWHTL